jgi:hypothetical protein
MDSAEVAVSSGPRLALVLFRASRRVFYAAGLPGVVRDGPDSASCSDVAGAVL